MRGSFRKSHAEEEEESAFVSMTDMTVSFLFIVMILLAFFASQFSDDDSVPRVQLEQMREQRDLARDELQLAQEEIARLEELLSQMEEQRDEALRTVDAQREEIEELLRRIAELEARIEELRERDPLEAYMARAAAARLKILEDLRDRLRVDFPGLMIEISAESDALRFQGEGLFQTARWDLQPQSREIVETIALRLEEILPCYTLGPSSSWSQGCNPSHAIIEAVQIEGHTDAEGPELSNLQLSTNRANATFAAMIERAPNLDEHLNYRDQPVLSVAGYGEMRPVATNDTSEGRSTNRRIDLRIIMHTPARSEEIETIQKSLRGAADGGAP